MCGAGRTTRASTLLEDLTPARALAPFSFVTPAVRTDLEGFVALLGEWQWTHNLVSRSAMGEIWSRHVADSLQLLLHAPTARRWVDLGTGGGFPGLVVAIALKENRETRFTLVESNGKKAAFLRAAIRATGANAEVAAERIEEHGARMAGQADVVSARALAPLKNLCALAAPYLHQGGALLLLKGQDFVSEHREALTIYDYSCERFPSLTDPEGSVVAIRDLTRKGGGP